MALQGSRGVQAAPAAITAAALSATGARPAASPGGASRPAADGVQAIRVGCAAAQRRVGWLSPRRPRTSVLWLAAWRLSCFLRPPLRLCLHQKSSVISRASTNDGSNASRMRSPQLKQPNIRWVCTRQSRGTKPASSRGTDQLGVGPAAEAAAAALAVQQLKVAAADGADGPRRRVVRRQRRRRGAWASQQDHESSF